MLISITFNSTSDFQFVQEQLQKVLDSKKQLIVDQGGLMVSVAIEPYDTKTCFNISKCLALCVTTIYENQWMDQLLRSTYFFQDDDEIAEISAIARSIGEGDREDVPGAMRFTNREKLVLEAAYACIEQGGTISFDSFIRFRMRPYRSLLNALVGEAIDEYKLEQEYQNFVDALRFFLKKREPIEKRVVLVFDGDYRLYDSQGRDLPLQMEQLSGELPDGLRVDDIDPDILLPLLILAPEEIYLYTDHSEEGLAQTIRNVFEERLHFFSHRMSKIHFSGNH
ncbi:sporulation protein YtxC [Pseudalkalibacillus hwajinpoensis]|uniref:sporulation protein YtxC n=1 Tax=Guptibacillus hwajinpoensis TaxID=208199 RepID=UPI00325AEF4A